jgi:hypothetical protein
MPKVSNSFIDTHTAADLSLSVNNIPPFVKGGEGGFSQGVPKQIPLNPPFSKGDLEAINYLRISS